MDKAKRKQLIEIAKSRGYTDMAPPRVLVTRQEFFDGNDDDGSIGCNLIEHPGIATFDAAFRQVEEMDRVAGVYLAITEIDETYDGIWPFTDTALIVTRLPAAVFEPLFRPLQPDEIASSDESFANPPEIPAGYQLIRAWWD
ncbi:hypothetical protein [Pedosphaera parvula]|uniref:Uncharacterized protein n=1 Tax=Pedosphaera parvula (strain Ellin514) TaxID=320771 RepID=B9XDG8_PEDPL|nr:hypothetical protein [Pedosphaera parvula]EEF62114.1 conserved hypothetical protein [Pedosphaera parvula Ellin514]